MMQDFLRKSVKIAGSLVEKAEHLFKKKPSSSGSQNRSLSTLPISKLQKLLESIEREEIAPLLPQLTGKKALQMILGSPRPAENLFKKGAEQVFNLATRQQTDRKPAGKAKDKIPFSIQGNPVQTPFSDDSFDFLLFFGSNLQKADSLDWMKESGRILKDGSRVIVCAVHPFLEYLLNPQPGFRHRLEHYYMALRKAGIYVEQVKEIYAEEGVRSFQWLAETDESLAPLKGLPLLLLLKAIRLKKQ